MPCCSEETLRMEQTDGFGREDGEDVAIVDGRAEEKQKLYA